MSEVIYEVRDRVGYITLNRPEQRNAINKNMAEGLFKALEDVKNNPEVWVCLITGNGKDFSTGHDLNLDKPRNWLGEIDGRPVRLSDEHLEANRSSH